MECPSGGGGGCRIRTPRLPRLRVSFLESGIQPHRQTALFLACSLEAFEYRALIAIPYISLRKKSPARLPKFLVCSASMCLALNRRVCGLASGVEHHVIDDSLMLDDLCARRTYGNTTVLSTTAFPRLCSRRVIIERHV